MPGRPYNLAIETSGRRGSVSLGRGDELLDTAVLPPQERHRVDLIPAIDELCRRHGARPEEVGELYLSIGPGSFTGLRIAVTTAKMLAAALGTRLVAVPTLEVVAQNAEGFEFRPRMVASIELGDSGCGPQDSGPGFQVRDPEGRGSDLGARSSGAGAPAPGWVASNPSDSSNRKLETQNSKLPRLAVCLNLKQDTVYAGLFAWQETAQAWVAHAPVALVTLHDLLAQAPRPVAVIGEVHSQAAALPAELLRGVTLLPADLATGRSEAVWRLGQAAARRAAFVDPLALLPLYVRVPEAEELWKKRHG